MLCTSHRLLQKQQVCVLFVKRSDTTTRNQPKTSCCFVVSSFRRSLSSCHSLYGIELASEGTSVFFSLMGVVSSSSIPSTKTPAHNALQRTRGSSFPCNEPKEKKMSQNWEFGNLSKNVGVEIHKTLARLTNAEKNYNQRRLPAWCSCIPFFANDFC